MRLTRAVLPGMVEGARGAIVTVASKASLSAGASGAAYAASKHGVIGLVKSVAYFYGPQGRSNAVLPGEVATASARPPRRGRSGRSRACAAVDGDDAAGGQADRIAGGLVARGDEASFVNGATVTADGGWATARDAPPPSVASAGELERGIRASLR